MNDLTLDEVYGMLKTHDLDIQHRRNRKESKGKAVALNVQIKDIPIQRNSSSRCKNVVNSDDSNTDSETDEDSSDQELVQAVAFIVKGLK